MTRTSVVRSVWQLAVAGAVLVGFVLPSLTFANTSSPPAKKQRPHATAPTLRLAMPDASPQIDPSQVEDDENVRLSQLLYSGLVRLDATYRVVGDVAKSWTISSDHRTYTFHLKHGLRFSNGDPLTADDVDYSIARCLNPGLKSASAPYYLLDIEGASAVLTGKAKTVRGLKVIDPYTIQITARWPVPYFLMELTYPASYILDARVMKKVSPIDSTGWYSNPVSSGPYRLKAWSPNNSITLVPNKYYASHPAFGQIQINLSALPTSDTYSWISHNVDVATLPSYNSTALMQNGVHDTTILSIDGVYMNMKVKPLDDPRVRRALILAVDRNKVVTWALKGTVSPFQGYVPQGEMGYYPRLAPLPYNPAGARAALKAAGYADGKNFPSLTVYYWDDPNNGGIAKLVKAITRAWHKNLGISIDDQSLNYSTLETKAQSSSIGLYLLGWTADYPDPHDWLSLQWEPTALNNNVHYNNSRFNKLVQAADVTWNQNRRMQLYNQAQNVLVSDAAWMPLYTPHQLVYIRPSIANLHVTGYGIIPHNGNWASVYVQSPAVGHHRVR